MTVNPINPRQQFVPNERVRLEVETTPTTPDGLVNINLNPSGDLGAWGWSAVNGTLDIGGVSGTLGLRFKQTGASAGYLLSYYLPVSAGQWVSARYDLLSVAASRNVKVRFNWYDASRNLLSATTDTGTGTAAGTFYSTSAQAPANTKYVRLVVWLYNGASGAASVDETFVVRNVMVTKNATNTFTTIRKNLVTNPSFETNTTGWTAGSGFAVARVTTEFAVGTASLRISQGSGPSFGSTASAKTIIGGITAGKAYSVSSRIKGAANTSGAWMYLAFYSGANATGSVLSSTPAYVTPDGTWQTLTLNGITAPAGAVSATVSVLMSNLVNYSSAGAVFGYVDAFLLEQATTSGAYFDGSTTLTGYTCAWTGTAHNSTSTATSVVNTYDFVEPRTFQNILGDSHDITITRAPLDASTLLATVVNPDLDPADTADDVLGVGRTIRCTAQVYYPNLDGYVWEPIYTGFIDDVVTTYVPIDKETGETKRRIEVHALDAAQALANLKAADGYDYLLGHTKSTLPLTNVPYLINYQAWPSTTGAAVCAKNADASVLDQIAITRDTVRGRAFIDRKGRLQAWDPNNTPLDFGEIVASSAFTLANATRSGDGWSGTLTAIAAGNVTFARTFPVEMAQDYSLFVDLATAGADRTVTVTMNFLALDYATVIPGESITLNGTVAGPGIGQVVTVPQGAYAVRITAVIASAAAGQVFNYDYSQTYFDWPIFTSDSLNPDGTWVDSFNGSYTEIDASFATHACINVVNVNWNRYDPVTQETTQVPYGPYIDQNSIDDNGPYAATFTIQGATEDAGAIAAYAQAVLATNAIPARQANAITVPVWDDQSMRHAVVYDLGTLMGVRLWDETEAAFVVNSDARIGTITHHITIDKWLVDYTFDPVDAVASPQVTPIPPDASVWVDSFNAFRVGPVLVQTGTVNLAGVVAAGATGNVTVTFPVAFSATPRIEVTGNNSRLNVGQTNKSAAGFTVTYANWTAAATALAGSFDWVAIGPA